MRERNSFFFCVIWSVVSSSVQDLDIAIVKATNHVECPPKERHLRREWVLILVETRAHHMPVSYPPVSARLMVLGLFPFPCFCLQRSSSPPPEIVREPMSPTRYARWPEDCPRPRIGLWVLFLNCLFIKSAIAGCFLDFFHFQLNINTYLAKWCILVSGRTENADSDTQATPRR
jgi:hypothetical protein